MKKAYAHMLSPVKVGPHVLKNRLLSSCCMPSFLAGPESWVPESCIRFFENIARSGASLVTVRDQSADTTGTPLAHSPYWHVFDPKVQNYMSQLSDRIHFQGALASIMYVPQLPHGFDVSENEMVPPPPIPGQEEAGGMPDPLSLGGPGDMAPPDMAAPGGKLGANGYPLSRELTHEMIRELIDGYVRIARSFQCAGFDAITIHMAYSGPVPVRFLSPLINRRTDEYGGSLENRARFALELFRAIKKGCGKDFLIEMEISGEEEAGGMTLEETISFARMCEGLVDIIQLRQKEINISHPTGYTWKGGVPKTLEYAAAFKAAGVKALISPSGGFGDYDVIEEAIASGKCDAVDMARAYIVEPEFARKAAEGRKEDRIPCIGCNKCHNPPKNKWSTICSVNPMLGLAHSAQSMVRPAVRKKNVAIIGGGPAGMRAAIFCRERGHSVTIYEKSGVLGGQLTHADYPDFKWPLKEYKDYLIRQVTKDDGITVRMNTEATPDMISAEAYDAVIVAIGAEPVIPPVPGADTVKAWTPIGVYGHEQELGKRVVIVGGGDSGTETGIYLADCGHDVTVLTRKFALASDNMGVHFYDTMKEYWERLPNFRGVVNATTTKVEPGKVFYADAEGDHVLECDSIVLCGGVRARDDLVMAFWNCAPEVVAAGDCLKPGALNDVNFSAYSAACRL